jgi:uncharacterized protein YqgV (UPF0045/DUF77 family)
MYENATGKSITPLSMKTSINTYFDEMAETIKKCREKVVAVGVCGLDANSPADKFT